MSFTELSVGQIARAAGMSRSTFYLYFADKTELLVRLSSAFKLNIFAIGEGWSPEAASGGLDELARLYRSVVAYMREHAGLLAAITEVAAYDAMVRAAWTAGEEQFVTRFAQQLAADQQDPLLDAYTAARVMVWGCEQVIVRQVLTGDPEDDAKVVTELATAHWYGTFRRSPGRPDRPA